MAWTSLAAAGGTRDGAGTFHSMPPGELAPSDPASSCAGVRRRSAARFAAAAAVGVPLGVEAPESSAPPPKLEVRPRPKKSNGNDADPVDLVRPMSAAKATGVRSEEKGEAGSTDWPKKKLPWALVGVPARNPVLSAELQGLG